MIASKPRAARSVDVGARLLQRQVGPLLQERVAQERHRLLEPGDGLAVVDDADPGGDPPGADERLEHVERRRVDDDDGDARSGPGGRRRWRRPPRWRRRSRRPPPARGRSGARPRRPCRRRAPRRRRRASARRSRSSPRRRLVLKAQIDGAPGGGHVCSSRRGAPAAPGAPGTVSRPCIVPVPRVGHKAGRRSGARRGGSEGPTPCDGGRLAVRDAAPRGVARRVQSRVRRRRSPAAGARGGSTRCSATRSPRARRPREPTVNIHEYQAKALLQVLRARRPARPRRPRRRWTRRRRRSRWARASAW